MIEERFYESSRQAENGRSDESSNECLSKESRIHVVWVSTLSLYGDIVSEDTKSYDFDTSSTPCEVECACSTITLNTLLY